MLWGLIQLVGSWAIIALIVAVTLGGVIGALLNTRSMIAKHQAEHRARRQRADGHTISNPIMRGR